METLVGWRLKNNVPVAEFYGKGTPRRNYLADLSRDRSVAVRKQLAVTVGQWCTRMAPEDLYEQEVRILPYLLSGLFDEDESIASFALDEMERLGTLHAQVNEKDYKERMEYSVAHEAAAEAAYTIPLPPPFTRRPSLGARGRVRDHFRAHIYPIMAELAQWTARERLQSAQLLLMLLVFVEQHVTEFAHQLLPALAKAIEADEPKGLVRKESEHTRLPPPLSSAISQPFPRNLPPTLSPTSRRNLPALSTLSALSPHLHTLTPPSPRPLPALS